MSWRDELCADCEQVLVGVDTVSNQSGPSLNAASAQRRSPNFEARSIDRHRSLIGLLLIRRREPTERGLRLSPVGAGRLLSVLTRPTAAGRNNCCRATCCLSCCSLTRELAAEKKAGRRRPSFEAHKWLKRLHKVGGGC